MGSDSVEVEIITACRTPDIPDPNLLVECEFEIFGHVQGIGFTKDCRDNCMAANITGWVKNSKRGTIVGKMQGFKPDLDKLCHWLSSVGSPGCQIERAEFTNWRESASLTFTDFQIRF